VVEILTLLLLLLLPGFSFERGPLDFTAKLLPTHDAPLLNHLVRCAYVSVTSLAPSIFEAYDLDQ
jgi:hypothetical protein